MKKILFAIAALSALSVPAFSQQAFNSLSFGIEAGTAQWIMSIYPLVSGIMVPVSAFLIDRFSTRRLFFAATGTFAIGTALCALSPTFFL